MSWAYQPLLLSAAELSQIITFVKSILVYQAINRSHYW